MKQELKNIGFDESYYESSIIGIGNFKITRVVSVYKGTFIVSDGILNVEAELSGKMINYALSPSDFPTVGDWVLTTFYNDNKFSIIHAILPRKSVIKRKISGKNVKFQLIASNIDSALIIQSLNEDFNLRRLERYLTIVAESNIKPIVLLSKSDLVSSKEVREKSIEIKKEMPSTSIEIHSFSNKNSCNVKNIFNRLVPRKTYCLLGSSGVGKTTLLNNFLAQSKFKTGEVRKKNSKGRHITSYRHLVVLENGAILIDTPGLKEVGIFLSHSGFTKTFSEIYKLSLVCKFNNCSHVKEKGCAVLDALKKGLISEGRYQNYLKMGKEIAFNEMSYYEKRSKDKKFGKFCKAVMKHKK